MDVRNIGRRRSAAEIKQQLFPLLFCVLAIEGFYLWLCISVLREGLNTQLAISFLGFSFGLYNLLGFLFGLPVYSIGGTDKDYGGRLMGLFFSLIFILSGIVIPARF